MLKTSTTTLLYVAGILALTFLLNAGALGGYWRFDDGYLLDYASRFSPWDYFFDPAITRGYSLNNLTPFNPLIFDINLGLFGFNSTGFYLQHITTLAACGIASFFLLRLWTPASLAFLGSVCFLVGAPTLFVAQQLMVGHYIAGLLFAIVATYCYAQSLLRQDWRLALAGALFYVLATTCKEIYFPLPFVIVFLNLGGWQLRFFHALPMFIWSFAYLTWRTITLGSLVGGYDSGPRDFSLLKALSAYLGIPELLLGGPIAGIGLILLLLIMVGYLGVLRRLNWSLVIVAGLAVLLPLAPLTHFPGLSQPNRYLFLPWWMIAVFLSVALGQLPRPGTALKSLMLTGIIALSLSQAWHVQAEQKPKLERFDSVYRFFINAPLDQLYYSRDIKDAYYLDTVLNGARHAEARLSGRASVHRGLLVKEGSIELIDRSRYAIMSYDEKCGCIAPVITRKPQMDPVKRTETPHLLTLALLPPFPPLFSSLDGGVQLSFSQDTSVTLQAEWTGPANDAEHELVLIAPHKPQRHKVRLITDPDETRTKVAGSLTLNLYYDDPTQAQQAATQSCLLIRSALTPLRLLLAGAPAQCQGLHSKTP